MKLGFIGAGNMGSAIISGILNKGALPADCIYVSRKHPEKGAELARKGVHIMKDNLRWFKLSIAFCWPSSPFTLRMSFERFTMR